MRKCPTCLGKCMVPYDPSGDGNFGCMVECPDCAGAKPTFPAVYILRNARTREPVKQGGRVVTFPSKPLAKAARNSLMVETGENFVVSLGPDHKRARA